MRKLRAIWNDRGGVAAAEYALFIAIIGAAMTFGALALGTAITDEVDQPVECTSATVAAGADC